MGDGEFGRIVGAGMIGMVVAGAAALTWSVAWFVAYFTLFGVEPEPPGLGIRGLMHLVVPALFGLATVPIVYALGAGRRFALGVSGAVFVVGAVPFVAEPVGSAPEAAGVVAFLLVAFATPALAVFAASLGGRLRAIDAVVFAGALALSNAVLALLVAYACWQSSSPLALPFGLCAWVVSPAVAGLLRRQEAGMRSGTTAEGSR